MECPSVCRLSRRRWFLAFFIGILLNCLHGLVSASPEQKQLVEDLFINNKYSRIVRPVLNESYTVNVTLELDLGQINLVNEKFQTLSTMVWLTQRWRDEYLMWDPLDYNNLTVLRIPASKIWLPDTVLYNTVEQKGARHENDTHESYSLCEFTAYDRQKSNDQLMTVETLTIVQYDGMIDWSAPLTMISECNIDVYLYPFDKQECKLKMGSWQHDRRYIDYLEGRADAANYNYNGEWDTLAIVAHSNIKVYSCCPDKEYPDVTFTINIRRKPLFYIVNLVIPCVLISMMSMVEFILPCNSGEKVSLGITVLLSLTVFMLVIAENMPATSDSIPVLARYYIITIFLVSFSTVMTVLVLSLHHRRAHVPRWVRHVFLRVLSSILCMSVDSPKCGEGSSYTHPSGTPSLHGSGGHFELMPQISSPASLSPSSTDHMLKEESAINQTGDCFGETDPGMQGVASGVAGGSCGVGHHHQPPPQRFSWKDRAFMDIQTNLRFLACRYAERDRDEQVTTEWQNVARVVDRFFLIIYLICVVLMDTIMVLQIK